MSRTISLGFRRGLERETKRGRARIYLRPGGNTDCCRQGRRSETQTAPEKVRLPACHCSLAGCAAIDSRSVLTYSNQHVLCRPAKLPRALLCRNWSIGRWKIAGTVEAHFAANTSEGGNRSGQEAIIANAAIKASFRRTLFANPLGAPPTDCAEEMAGAEFEPTLDL